jgi:hypothetical protein
MQTSTSRSGDMPPESQNAISSPSPLTTRKRHRVHRLIRAWAPPLDPFVVVAEVSEIVKPYGVAALMGDNYAGEWPVEPFRNCGIAYERAEKNKSELYLALVPTVNDKQIELLAIAS